MGEMEEKEWEFIEELDTTPSQPVSLYLLSNLPLVHLTGPVKARYYAELAGNNLRLNSPTKYAI